MPPQPQATPVWKWSGPCCAIRMALPAVPLAASLPLLLLVAEGRLYQSHGPGWRSQVVTWQPPLAAAGSSNLPEVHRQCLAPPLGRDPLAALLRQIVKSRQGASRD